MVSVRVAAQRVGEHVRQLPEAVRVAARAVQQRLSVQIPGVLEVVEAEHHLDPLTPDGAVGPPLWVLSRKLNFNF